MPLVNDDSLSTEEIIRQNADVQRAFGPIKDRTCKAADVVGNFENISINMRSGAQTRRVFSAKEIVVRGVAQSNKDNGVAEQLNSLTRVADENRQLLADLRALPAGTCCAKEDPCRRMLKNSEKFIGSRVRLESTGFFLVPLKIQYDAKTEDYSTVWLDVGPGERPPYRGKAMRVLPRLLTKDRGEYRWVGANGKSEAIKGVEAIQPERMREYFVSQGEQGQSMSPYCSLQKNLGVWDADVKELPRPPQRRSEELSTPTRGIASEKK